MLAKLPNFLASARSSAATVKLPPSALANDTIDVEFFNSDPLDGYTTAPYKLEINTRCCALSFHGSMGQIVMHRPRHRQAGASLG